MVDLDDGVVRDWLAERLGSAVLADDASLFESGRLSSFDLVDLVSVVEQASGRRIRAMDVTLANFDSIDKIRTFLARLT